MAYAVSPGAWGDRRARRIGVLGGSFNPGHAGHRHISVEALRRLCLDEVWWLVSPQNPLKPVAGMAPQAQRAVWARAAASHPAIAVTTIESRWGTRYTADTLAVLLRRFPRARFVWLMGADNLIQFPRWDRWTDIVATLPIAVFARPSYSVRALAGRAAVRFARRRVPDHRAGTLAAKSPPAWVFVHTRPHPASATAIRARATMERSRPFQV